MSHAQLTLPRLRSWHVLGSLLMMCAGSSLSCDDHLEGFTSKPGQAYCGTIGLPHFQSGLVEEGSPPSWGLALSLDTSQLTTLPGILNSNDLQGLCGTPEAPQPLFSGAPLRAIPDLQQDVLSALTFGEGHEHDFFAWVDSTCQGTMLLVVSLMKNNYVEVRLFKPAPLSPSMTAAESPGFAVFHLYPKDLHKPKEEGGCGIPPAP